MRRRHSLKWAPTSSSLFLAVIAEGLSSKEIGNQLSTHYRTVENHRTNICRKLKIEGANELLRFGPPTLQSTCQTAPHIFNRLLKGRIYLVVRLRARITKRRCT